MINYKLFKDNGFTIKKIIRINNAYVISNGNKKCVVKENKTNLYDMFNYLNSRNFHNLPDYHKLSNYDIFDFIEDSNLSIEERLFEAINLIILLHTKTTRYEKVDLDDYKIIYEDLLKKIEELNNYYISLNDQIDKEIYMAPSHYLLVRNISKIYGALSFCINELDNWYELIKTSTKQRVVLIHNNLDLSHILYNKKPYLISWNNSKIDIPIYDLVNLYDKYYNNSDFSVLLNNYQSKYPLFKEELKLFFVIISIPLKIEFTSDEIENIKLVKSIINRISIGDKLIRPYYEKKENSVKS